MSLKLHTQKFSHTVSVHKELHNSFIGHWSCSTSQLIRNTGFTAHLISVLRSGFLMNASTPRTQYPGNTAEAISILFFHQPAVFPYLPISQSLELSHDWPVISKPHCTSWKFQWHYTYTMLPETSCFLFLLLQI